MSEAGSKVDDLSELGKEYSGFRPKAKKKQTIAEFEESELKDEKKGIEVSWMTFIKTKYFSEAFDASNITDYGEEKAETEVKSDEEKTSSKDAKTVEGAEMPGLDAFSAPKDEMLPTPSSTDSPTGNTIDKETVRPTVVKGFERVTTDAIAKFTDVKPSLLAQRITSVYERPYFVFQGEFPNFSNPTEFRDARIDFIDQVIMKYGSGMLSDVPKQIEEKYRREKINVPGKLGANYVQMVDALTTDLYASGVEFIKNLRVGKVSKTKEDAIYYGMQDEAALINAFFAIDGMRHIDYDLYVKFVSRIYQEDYFLIPLQPLPDPDFHKMWHHNPGMAMNWMRDRSSILNEEMVLFNEGVLRAHISVPTKVETQAAVELLKLFQASMNTFDEVTSFPSTLSSSSAADFVWTLVLATADSRYACITMDIDFMKLSLEQLISCLLMKIFVPIQAVEAQTRRDIDNYIFMYLIPALNINYGSSNNKRDFDKVYGHIMPMDLFGSHKNYLKTMLADLNNHETLRNFLMSTIEGNGWAGAGSTSKVKWHKSSKPSDKVSFVNGARTYRYYTVGKPQNSRYEVPEQFKRFMMFVKKYVRGETSLSFKADERRIGVGLSQLIGRITRFANRAASFAWNFDKIINNVTLSSFVYPTAPSDLMVDSEMNPIVRSRRRIDVGSVISCLMLVEHEKIKINNVDLRFIDHGINLNHVFNELAVRYHLVRDNYIRPDENVERFYPDITKTDLLEKMLKRMTAHSSILQTIVQSIGAYPAIYDYMTAGEDSVFPPKEYIDYDNNPYVLKFKAAEKFVDKNLALFGVASHFYYGDVRKQLNNPAFSKGWIANASRENVTPISYDEYVTLVQEEGVDTVFSSAIERGDLIRFDFPIKFKYTELGEVLNEPDPISLVPGSDGVKTTMVNVWYQWEEEFRNRKSNATATMRDPRWLLDEEVERQIENNFFADNYARYVQKLLSYRRGYKILSPQETFKYGKRNIQELLRNKNH
jgi:hypothetical protein